MKNKKYTDRRGPAKYKSPTVINEVKTGRNEPCPCGSGKKHKKCCLFKVEEIKETLKEAGLPADDKGEPNGTCNITSCKTGLKANWFNHSTRKFYCVECAARLNNDPFNRRDAMEMFGHDLCTEMNLI